MFNLTLGYIKKSQIHGKMITSYLKPLVRNNFIFQEFKSSQFSEKKICKIISLSVI